jgi:large subunit ribosomal protein L25
MSAEVLVLKAEKRQSKGTRVSRKLRQQGMIPAIIYGHKEDPVAVQLNAHDLALELQHHHRVLEVDLADHREKCLVKDVQYDYLGEKILHVDLTRVRVDERVEVTVPLELRGTPAGVAEGGVLDQILSEIEIECLVTEIPEVIKTKVNDMQIDQILTAGEIELPAGTNLITDPDAPVAAVRLMAEEVVEEEEIAPAEEGTAEPEVIQREKAEEGESES